MNELETLKLFNEKAETLKGYERFMESIRERKVEFKQSPETAGVGITRVQGPDHESISACVLTIRLFMQNNEAISFGNMEKVYHNLGTSQENKNEFNQIRDELNRHLNSGSPFKMSDEGFELLASPPYENTLPNREILELFVYGEFSHTNQIKREKLKQVLSYPPFAALAWHIFTSILIEMIKCIFAVAVINQRVISEIEV